MKLNPEQSAAAHYQGSARHLLVLAGAGTGKTRTIIGRILFLIQQGAPAERLLMLTFTRRAAKEMLLRLHNEVGNVADSITAGTFHHFCLQVMRRVPKPFGVEERTVIDRDDAQSLLQLIRGERLKKGEKRDFPNYPAEASVAGASAEASAEASGSHVKDIWESFGLSWEHLISGCSQACMVVSAFIAPLMLNSSYIYICCM